MNVLNPLTRPAVPVDADLALLEPSFADAVAAIAGDPNLSAAVKTHWCCSLRRIAAFLDRPMVLLPARWTAVRIPASRLRAPRLEVTQKTLLNHLSNVRAALAWMHKEKLVPARGAPLSPEWQGLSDQCPKLPHRARLLPLMRFCSAANIAPGAVDEAVIDSLMDYRRSTTSLAVDAKARRALARYWNDRVRAVAGWPHQLLVEPPSRTPEAFPPWAAYPIVLREEIEAYLDSLTRVRKTAKGKRVLPAKATTIKSRRSSLEAALRTASRIGIGMDELKSLSCFLDPAVSRRVLEAYWPEGPKQPPIFAVDLCGLFISMAHSANCLPPEQLEEIKDMLADLKHQSPRGMTDKNLAAIRSFMQGEAWRALHGLPQVLMAEAKEASYASPTKAAIRAQLAVAIGILNVAPIRRGNLGAIRIGENLIRTGGPGSPYRLMFPNYDVKNRVRLDFPLDAELTALIDDYLFNYRPALLGRTDSPWLFPGEGGNYKTLKVLGDQITAVIERVTGLRLTPHQFRHVAAAIILKHKPGNYQMVRLLLGHRTVEITMRNYVGLETAQAGADYGDLVRDMRMHRSGLEHDDD
jgi:integrase